MSRAKAIIILRNPQTGEPDGRKLTATGPSYKKAKAKVQALARQLGVRLVGNPPSPADIAEYLEQQRHARAKLARSPAPRRRPAAKRKRSVARAMAKNPKPPKSKRRRMTKAKNPRRRNTPIAPGMWVKKRFTQKGENNELMWVKVKSVKGSKIVGTLDNEPFRLTNIKRGARVTLRAADVLEAR
jgi:hypothetical protein